MVIENHALPDAKDNSLFARVQRLRLRGYNSLKAAQELREPLHKVNKLWAPVNREIEMLPRESLSKTESIANG